MTSAESPTAHRTPQSAPEPPPEDQGAQRAGAREDSELHPEPGAAEEAGVKEHPRALLRRLEAMFRPPVVWSEPPPSLSALWRYAKSAEWADARGPARFLGIWWCRLIAIPASTAGYYALWLLHRPGRALTVAVIYFVLSQTSAGSWLPWLW